jgi:hypothetical protein
VRSRACPCVDNPSSKLASPVASRNDFSQEWVAFDSKKECKPIKTEVMDRIYQNAVLCENLFSVEPPQKKVLVTLSNISATPAALRGFLKHEAKGEFFAIVCNVRIYFLERPRHLRRYILDLVRSRRAMRPEKQIVRVILRSGEPQPPRSTDLRQQSDICTQS